MVEWKDLIVGCKSKILGWRLKLKFKAKFKAKFYGSLWIISNKNFQE